MTLHTALGAAATLISLAFALSTLERWLVRRKPHELMWTISLAFFSLGSLAFWAGAGLGWGEWSFKAFYLFGAILNVPYLALGTVYLLGRRETGDRWLWIVSLLGAFCAGVVIEAPVVGLVEPALLPRGSEVFNAGPRIAAAVASGVASVVIIGGALWSAARLVRTGRRPAGLPAPVLAPGRLALANVLIAAGTLVLGAGGTSNSVLDAMNAFAVSLVAGITLIFVGFLLTVTPAAARPVEPWRLPASLATRRASAST